MKNLILVSLMFISSAVMAESFTILDTRISTGYGINMASSSFYMDTETGEGFANISVSEQDFDHGYPFPGSVCNGYSCYPGNHYPTPIYRTIFRTTVELENIKLVEKEMIYMGDNGEVNCGKLGTSRVLRRPTLYLTGNCKLTEKLLHDRLIVTLTIK